MRKLLIAASALAGIAAASPASAAATVLTFSGDVCTANPCSDGGAIAASYGDGAGVDVSYASYLYPGGAQFNDFLRFWDVGYGDLQGVVWGGGDQANYSSRITLTALAGYEISLRSFDIATYHGISSGSPVLIESLGGAGIFAGNVATLSPLHNHVTVDSGYFSDGIVLNWGPDGYNVSLDNIAFEVRALSASPIPEPANWTMMILGLGAAGSLIRRRRAKPAPSY